LAPRKPTIEPLESDERAARAFCILHTLQHGLDAIDAEIDALRIEEHLGLQKTIEDQRGRVRGNKLRLNSRNAALRARLAKHRATVPAPNAEEPPAGELPASVAAALEIIRGSRPPSRVSRQKLIEQLENDKDVIRAAIIAQTTVVDALRDELSSALAARLVSKHRELTLAIFRSAQAFAAASDAEAEFRRAVVDAGFTWREDLLRGPQLRAALVLGSESTFDSDISRARRALEELKIL
jgi:hypothetical protein